MELDIFDLNAPLPRYVLIINEDGWGGTWCAACVFRVLSQDVPGRVVSVPISELKSMGIAIDVTKLRRHHGRVVVIRESTVRTCRICDFATLMVADPEPDRTPVACINPCCAGHP